MGNRSTYTLPEPEDRGELAALRCSVAASHELKVPVLPGLGVD